MESGGCSSSSRVLLFGTWKCACPWPRRTRCGRHRRRLPRTASALGAMPRERAASLVGRSPPDALMATINSNLSFTLRPSFPGEATTRKFAFKLFVVTNGNARYDVRSEARVIPFDCVGAQALLLFFHGGHQHWSYFWLRGKDER